MDAEKEFKSLTENSDDGQIQDLVSQLAEFQSMLDSIAPAIAEASTQEKLMDAQINGKKKEILKLEEAKKAVKNAVWDARKKQRELEASIASKQRLLAQASENKSLREEFERLSSELDKLTANAEWRKFAFPHQITGAKKLAMQHRAILADKRGLGKTLTSLVYCDMVQAQKILAVVPNDTVDNFIREINHWSPHRTPVRMANLPKIQRDAVLSTLKHINQFIIVLNYEAWRRDKSLLDKINDLQIDTLIMDESHNIKNRNTSAYKGLKTLVTSPNCCTKCGSGNLHEEVAAEYSGRY